MQQTCCNKTLLQQNFCCNSLLSQTLSQQWATKKFHGNRGLLQQYEAYCNKKFRCNKAIFLQWELSPTCKYTQEEKALPFTFVKPLSTHNITSSLEPGWLLNESSLLSKEEWEHKSLSQALVKWPIKSPFANQTHYYQPTW